MHSLYCYDEAWVQLKPSPSGVWVSPSLRKLDLGRSYEENSMPVAVSLSQVDRRVMCAVCS